MLVAMRSGECEKSLKRDLPEKRSRMIRRVHLSPSRSRVQATGQGERRGKVTPFITRILHGSGERPEAGTEARSQIPCHHEGTKARRKIRKRWGSKTPLRCAS